MKSIGVKPDSYAECNVDSNEKDSRFKVGDHVRISKCKNILAPNCSEEVFVISKSKNAVSWTYVIHDLNGEKNVGTFYEKECTRLIKKNLEYKK